MRSWEGRIEDKKLRRERRVRSAACHPSLGQRSRRLHDSPPRPERLSRGHTPCLVDVPACSMGTVHQHTNHMETSCISMCLPTLFSPSVVTHHHMSTQKKEHVSISGIFYMVGSYRKSFHPFHLFFFLHVVSNLPLFRNRVMIGSSSCADL